MSIIRQFPTIDAAFRNHSVIILGGPRGVGKRTLLPYHLNEIFRKKVVVGLECPCLAAILSMTKEVLAPHQEVEYLGPQDFHEFITRSPSGIVLMSKEDRYSIEAWSKITPKRRPKLIVLDDGLGESTSNLEVELQAPRFTIPIERNYQVEMEELYVNEDQIRRENFRTTLITVDAPDEVTELCARLEKTKRKTEHIIGIDALTTLDEIRSIFERSAIKTIVVAYPAQSAVPLEYIDLAIGARQTSLNRVGRVGPGKVVVTRNLSVSTSSPFETTKDALFLSSVKNFVRSCRLSLIPSQILEKWIRNGNDVFTGIILSAAIDTYSDKLFLGLPKEFGKNKVHTYLLVWSSFVKHMGAKFFEMIGTDKFYEWLDENELDETSFRMWINVILRTIDDVEKFYKISPVWDLDAFNLDVILEQSYPLMVEFGHLGRKTMGMSYRIGDKIEKYHAGRMISEIERTNIFPDTLIFLNPQRTLGV